MPILDESTIETPAVLIDLKVAEQNIRKFQDYADQHGLKVRPHIKTHKLPQLARLQLEAGAVGITCQKTSEAEAMVNGDPAITDVLITYNILGPEKLERLRALASRIRLAVTADNATVVTALSDSFEGAEAPLRVLVECDTGAARCGVLTPEAAAHLAESINTSPNLVFEGLMTYPPKNGGEAVFDFLRHARTLIEARGIAVPTVTSGGSPDMWSAETHGIVTEYRPGTYVYNDRSLVAYGTCSLDDCALTVLATVVSVPGPGRAIIDAGSKILTSDLLGLIGHGAVLGRPDIQIDQLSEEHGRLVCDGDIGLQVGQRIRIVPNHCCVVTNMMDVVYVDQGNGNIEPLPVVARGRVI